MNDQDTGTQGANSGFIALPHPDVMTYPIKITRVLIETGEGFQADFTPLYSAMDANGTTTTFGAGDAGKVMDVLISVGDIFTERANAFEVRYFATAPAEPAPAPVRETPAKAAPTPAAPPQDPAPEPAKQSTEGKWAPPRPAAKKRSSFVDFVLGVAILAGLAYGALQLLIYDEKGQETRFPGTFITNLYFSGPSPEARTSGSAVIEVPTGRDANGVTQYTNVDCDLTHAQYDVVRNSLARVGDNDYAWWSIWRSRIFRTLNCEFLEPPSRLNGATFDDRMMRMEPARLERFVEDLILKDLAEHDAKN